MTNVYTMYLDSIRCLKSMEAIGEQGNLFEGADLEHRAFEKD